MGFCFMKKIKITRSSKGKATIDVKQLVVVSTRKAQESPEVLDPKRVAYIQNASTWVKSLVKGIWLLLKTIENMFKIDNLLQMLT